MYLESLKSHREAVYHVYNYVLDIQSKVSEELTS